MTSTFIREHAVDAPVSQMAYADNFLYRDDTPTLPRPWYLSHRIDRRTLVPQSTPPIGADVLRAHTRTGAPTTEGFYRAPIYVHPGRDIAYQAACFLQYTAGGGRRVHDTAPSSWRLRVPETFFYALGNPPLASKEGSRTLVHLLQKTAYLEQDGVPLCLITAQQMQMLVESAPSLRAAVGHDFAPFGACAFNVAYDFYKFGRLEVWAELYKFFDAWAAYNAPESWQEESARLETGCESWARAARYDEIEAAFAHIEAMYNQQMLDEAVDAAAL